MPSSSSWCFFSTTMEEALGSQFFPSGFRLLVVDDDNMFLETAEAMLSSFNYQVTACDNPTVALSILLERPTDFDLLLTEVYMPEMDGFELMTTVLKNVKIPVVLMSFDTTLELMKRAIKEGASSFLEKPLQPFLVRTIWKNAAWPNCTTEVKMKMPVEEDRLKTPESANRTAEGNSKDKNKRKEKKVDDVENEDDSAIFSKKRLIWTPKLEKKFLNAIVELGIDAGPTRIARHMNVKGVGRSQIASHLQKYRLKLQKEAAMASQSSPVKNTAAPDYGYLMPQNNTPYPPVMVNSSNPISNFDHVEACINQLGFNPNIQMNNMVNNSLNFDGEMNHMVNNSLNFGGKMNNITNNSLNISGEMYNMENNSPNISNEMNNMVSNSLNIGGEIFNMMKNSQNIGGGDFSLFGEANQASQETAPITPTNMQENLFGFGRGDSPSIGRFTLPLHQSISQQVGNYLHNLEMFLNSDFDGGASDYNNDSSSMLAQNQTFGECFFDFPVFSPGFDSFLPQETPMNANQVQADEAGSSSKNCLDEGLNEILQTILSDSEDNAPMKDYPAPPGDLF